jgi:hypothetical protein
VPLRDGTLRRVQLIAPSEVWALGEDRFRITAAGHEQIVTGFEEAEKAADALAKRLG